MTGVPLYVYNTPKTIASTRHTYMNFQRQTDDSSEYYKPTDDGSSSMTVKASTSHPDVLLFKDLSLKIFTRGSSLQHENGGKHTNRKTHGTEPKTQLHKCWKVRHSKALLQIKTILN
jgi:hypothetical protein